MNMIDLRSDTVTAPTDEMRREMAMAPVGDDVYCDDPTINKLEKLAAEMVGKEAALFVPSGTFGNQLALFTHCRRGTEVIIGNESHIVCHECAASAIIAGVQLTTVETDGGIFDPVKVEDRIRKKIDVHYPQTSLICLENAHSSGKVAPLSSMREIRGIADKYNLPIHLDGARLFNASTYLGVDVKEITENVDSVMFCLSKALCAPVGSILAGTQDFIDRSRFGRKMMGGGLRQAGILAAAGIISLEKMTKRLGEDHENAKLLAEGLSNIPGIDVLKDDTQINMVFFKITCEDFNHDLFVEKLFERGIKSNPVEDGQYRFVTHYWVTKENVERIIRDVRACLKNTSE